MLTRAARGGEPIEGRRVDPLKCRGSSKAPKASGPPKNTIGATNVAVIMTAAPPDRSGKTRSSLSSHRTVALAFITAQLLDILDIIDSLRDRAASSTNPVPDSAHPVLIQYQYSHIYVLYARILL